MTTLGVVSELLRTITDFFRLFQTQIRGLSNLLEAAGAPAVPIINISSPQNSPIFPARRRAAAANPSGE